MIKPGLTEHINTLCGTTAFYCDTSSRCIVSTQRRTLLLPGAVQGGAVAGLYRALRHRTSEGYIRLAFRFVKCGLDFPRVAEQKPVTGYVTSCEDSSRMVNVSLPENCLDILPQHPFALLHGCTLCVYVQLRLLFLLLKILRGLSPQENYTDVATAACLRS
jgi:hypothetical protein